MKLFTDHPASVGETYFEHMGQAFSFAAAMAKGTLCCALHALFPFWCEKSASKIISGLNDRMVVNRDQRAPSVQSAEHDASSTDAA